MIKSYETKISKDLMLYTDIDWQLLFGIRYGDLTVQIDLLPMRFVELHFLCMCWTLVKEYPPTAEQIEYAKRI